MVEKVNVLLIEDDLVDVRIIQEIIQRNTEVEINLINTDNVAQGLKHLTTHHISVILLDLNLPDSKGLHTFTQIHHHSPQTPIIIMSGFADKEVIYKALQQGAQDYLIKGEMGKETVMRAILYAIWNRGKDA